MIAVDRTWRSPDRRWLVDQVIWYSEAISTRRSSPNTG
jgi:hypothetical protein